VSAPTTRDATIIADYQSGKTLKQVATRHGLTAERVRQILRDHNIQRRTPGQHGNTAYTVWATTHGDAIVAQMRANGSVRQTIAALAADHPKAWLRRLAQERITRAERLKHRRGPAYTDTELLTHLRTKAYGTGHLSGKDYDERRIAGEPALATYVLRFGSWSEACRQAGLNAHVRANPPKRRWTEMDMLQAVRQYAEHADTTGEIPTVLGYDAWRKTQPVKLPSFSTMRFQTGRNWLDLLKAVGR
jgi:Homing endonuclease associated repeat